MTRGELSVLVVDDQRMFTDALGLLIEVEEGMELFGTAGSAEVALRMCERRCPDVVLMDVDLPGMNGIAAIRELRERCPDARAVVITALMDPDLIVRAAQAGAIGFVSKQRAADELVQLVRAAGSGESVFLTSELQSIAGRLPQPAAAAPSPLTQRETEVLQGLADGLSTEELAATLFLSPRTIQGHVQSVLNKLGVRSKLEAVLHALRHDIVQLRDRTGAPSSDPP